MSILYFNKSSIIIIHRVVTYSICSNIFVFQSAQVKQSKEETAKQTNDSTKAGAVQNAPQKKNTISEVTSKSLGKKPVKPSVRPVKKGASGDTSNEGAESFKGVVTHELSVVGRLW